MSSTARTPPAHRKPLAAASLRAPGGPPRAQSLAQQLVERLAAQVRRGDFAPGAKLPTEAGIIAAYGVSRTVVREAISRLSAMGLVETRHGIGTFVHQGGGGNFNIDPTELATIVEVMALLELRISMEAEAAGLAAARRTGAQLKSLRRALGAFDANVDNGGDTVELDFRFHLQIAEATGNRYFAHLMSYLGTMIIPRTRVNTASLAQEDRTEYLRRVNREHEDICAAIARRDQNGARLAMRTHLANSRDRLQRAHEAATVAAARPGAGSRRRAG